MEKTQYPLGLFERILNNPHLQVGDAVDNLWALSLETNADFVLWVGESDEETVAMLSNLLNDLPYRGEYSILDGDAVVVLISREDFGYLLNLLMAYDYIFDAVSHYALRFAPQKV